MTYTTNVMRRRYRPKPPGLSGWFDDLIDVFVAPVTAVAGGGNDTCLAQANVTMAPFDAKIDDIAKTWNPTGFYSPADLRSLVAATLKVVQQGQAAVDQARAEPNAAQASTMRATNDLARAGQRSLDYLAAANAADGQGLRVINAPGLKRWVTDTLGAASSAMVTAAVIGCQTPWWVTALVGFQFAFDTLYNLSKTVVGVVLAVGETALRVAGDLPELYDILKYAALAAGGYWVWTTYLKER